MGGPSGVYSMVVYESDYSCGAAAKHLAFRVAGWSPTCSMPADKQVCRSRRYQGWLVKFIYVDDSGEEFRASLGHAAIDVRVEFDG